MSTPILDVGTLKAAGFGDIDPGNDSLLERIAAAATDEVEGYIGRTLIKPANDETRNYSGTLAVGRYSEVLNLRDWPIASITSVKENGVALTVGSGYSTTVDVLRDDTRGILIRRQGSTAAIDPVWFGAGARSWAPGTQNIEVVGKFGYADAASVPARLVQAAIEVALLMYGGPLRSGHTQVSRGTGSTSFVDLLSEMSRATMREFAATGRMRCF